jgi:hypothetical protein
MLNEGPGWLNGSNSSYKPDMDCFPLSITFSIGFDFWIFGVLTPLSAIFQLYHGDQC